MKKELYLLICLILIGSVCAEENLYRYSSLELELDVEGKLRLVAEGDGARVSSVKAELELYPENSFRQTLLDWESNGDVREDGVLFEWKDKRLGEKSYGFNAKVRTNDARVAIDKKVTFPLSSVAGYEEYLEATEHIDKDNPRIIEKAAELAEGEEDLFNVVFKLAKWVGENVEYELTSLTTGTSQKASWVLEHRQGVCDEMTNLFIAMCRTLGIPAKFVSGVSYTTSELFEESWLPHGWSEVYFPGYGWVSFDMAFGEYGYIDTTHLKLREGFDPAEASTKFEWLGSKVNLEAQELDFSVEIKKKGSLSKEEISLSGEVLSNEVQIGSHNLVKGTIENKNGYYTAATLRLTVPNEVEVDGEEVKIILLEPKEKKEVFWLVKVDEDLPQTHWYEFPVLIASERNVSVEKSFKASKEGIFYSKREAESLMLHEEEKRYVGKLSLDCEHEDKIKLGEAKEISCMIKNRGNMNLNGVKFCLGEDCKVINLLIGQEAESRITVEGKEAGWQKVIASAVNGNAERKVSLEYAVVDKPGVILETKMPEKVSYNEDFLISLKIDKDSFSIPEEVIVIMERNGFKNKWEMDELRGEQEFLVKSNSRGLGKENDFKISLIWKDDSGNQFKEEKTISLEVEGKNSWEKAAMWFNWITSFIK